MRFTDLFTRTLRDAPADAELPSHRLAVRAGLIRPVAAGSLALMPLGWRVMERLMTILRQEMDALGAQEVRLPLVQPAEIWQASGRWETFGPVLQRFESEAGRAFALGPTHEELVAALAAREIDSYRQLPQLLYQIQTKYRNEPRPRGGLIRLREFTMKDAYSLDADADGMRAQYERMVATYRRIFARVGLDVMVAEADSGAMGGTVSQEFLLPHPQGEDSFVACPACGYAANLEAATFRLAAPETAPLAPVRKVATPGCTTIQQVAAFLGVPEAQTLKAVFFMHTLPGGAERFVFVVIRGDLEVNEVKLLRALGGGTLRPAEEAEIRATGAVPGYASPLGLGKDVLVVADQSVQAGANFVAGANDDGYHLTGVNVPRDFVPGLLTDIALAYDGAGCPRCAEGTLRLGRAIELGHCFALGTFYSEALGVHYLDEHGVTQPVWMGSYGIGLERLMAAIIEAHHDDYGICWPAAVAPFDVHIVTIGGDAETLTAAQAVYRNLREAGFAVLLDDRNDSAGVKFADADLIGAPVRLTVSKKALAAGGVEVKRRTAPERAIVPLTALSGWLRGALT
jgi:prolyl-tRNA synthetase